MSNDYALFIIIVPNDFDLGTSVIPAAASPPSNVNTVSALMATAAIPLSILSAITPFMQGKNEPELLPTSQQSASLSICVLLKNYFAERDDVEAMWMMSDDKKVFQITFYVQYGLLIDRMLQDLAKLGIGRRNGTKVSVLPTTIVLNGRNHEKTRSSSNPIEDINTVVVHELSSIDEKSDEKQVNGVHSQDLTLSNRIRKRIYESDFKKSVNARLMVHQVVANIRASSAISFDFVLLICLASMLAAFGLLENSSVTIVASMLVSPLMNPIMGIVFGLSVRDSSLWRRGLRNETIGLIICITCGFLLGLFTTTFGTKWGSSSSFPTSEMRSRGDVKRLWVGVLIALPSGAGVALSVLGGNTGSLVGVAISASLLPPAVNCGLLSAYGLLGRIFSNIAATHSSILNNSSSLHCARFIQNDYQPLYTCNLSTEAAILACCSLLLTVVNIICIIIMALIILRIKEVVPLNQANKDITKFFRYDVKVARDFNKTIQEDDLTSNNPAAATLRANYLAQSIVNRWKTFKSPVSQNQLQPSTSIRTDLDSTNPTSDLFPNDIELRRKLFRLKTFANEYDLDLLNEDDCNLTNDQSEEKVRLLVSDLIDMYQEKPSVFIDLHRLQPSNTHSSSTDKEHVLFYQEMIELLPPKWYRLFNDERQRRQHISSWPLAFDRSYSMRLPGLETEGKSNEQPFHGSLKRQNKKNLTRFFRQSSMPASNLPSATPHPNTEIPMEGTRFRTSQSITATNETFEDD